MPQELSETTDPIAAAARGDFRGEPDPDGGPFGEREALVECATGRRWTYREFDAAVNVVAGGLLAAGLTKGDRLGIWAPNCAEWTLTQFATARLGVILVNINPAYRTHELQ